MIPWMRLPFLLLTLLCSSIASTGEGFPARVVV